MKLLFPTLSRFVRKPHRRLRIERGKDKQLNIELSALRHADPSLIGMANTLDVLREMTPPIHQRFRRRTCKHLLPRIAISSAVMAAVAGSIYWQFIERTPNYTPEYEATVNIDINAFDTYSDLISSIDLGNISDLRQFNKNGEWDAEKTLRAGEYNIPDNDHALILKTTDAILQRNVEQLRNLRSALNVTYIDPNRYHLDGQSVVAMNFTRLQSLLLLDAVAAQEREDYAHAAYAALDALQLTMQVQHYTHLGRKMSLMRWESPIRDLLWDVLPKLDAATLEETSKRLDGIIALSDQTTVTKALKHEKIYGQKTLLHLFKEPNWRWKVASDYYSGRAANRPTWLKFASLLKRSKQEIFNNYSAGMKEEIERSKQPYALNKQHRENKLLTDPLSETLVPFWSNAIFRDTISHTQNKLLRAAMAIEYHRLLTGKYFDEGTPYGYGRNGTEFGIPAVNDPFSADANRVSLLRYKRTEKGYLLYSIGPDGKDDGGKAIIKTPSNEGLTKLYHIYPESEGDIVAGINRQ